jgi:hypothetical protein
MMLRWLFSRESTVVRLVEALGVLLTLASVQRLLAPAASPTARWLCFAVIVLYLFIRICATIRWYRGVPPFSGIERQFADALVAASYILALVMGWYLLAGAVLPLAIAAVPLLFFAYVNVILIFFHLRDRDAVPVNYYSSGRFLSEDTPREGTGSANETRAAP